MGRPQPFRTPGERGEDPGPLRDAGSPSGDRAPSDPSGPVGSDTLDDLRGYEPSNMPDLTGTGDGPLG
jgi:hypothetical protein